VNSQELFLDVSSGRFLDGSTNIPSAKPVIYSKEKRRIAVNLYKVAGNARIAVTPSSDSTFGIRLGSQTLKLADGANVPTAPIFPTRATATIVTQPSSRPVAVANIYDDPVVTATLQATVSTFPVTTATFIMQTAYTAPITASIVAYIGASTLPAITKSISVASIPATDFFTPGVRGIVLELTPTLNSPITATFLSSIANGSISTIGILSIGNGYPNGTYPLTIAGASPVRATFTSTISDGSVTSIAIVTAGSGYGTSDIAIVFSHGNAGANAKTSNGSISSVEITNVGSGYTTAPIVTIATASAITASANATAVGGKITSITIVSSGSGYSSNPSISFFTPLQQLADLIPSNQVGVLNTADNARQFRWVTATAGLKVDVIFSSVTASTSVTLPTNSVPSAFLVNVGLDLWKTQIVNNGYGYTATPTASHASFNASPPRLACVREIGRGLGVTPQYTTFRGVAGLFPLVKILQRFLNDKLIQIKSSSFCPQQSPELNFGLLFGKLGFGNFFSLPASSRYAPADIEAGGFATRTQAICPFEITNIDRIYSATTNRFITDYTYRIPAQGVSKLAAVRQSLYNFQPTYYTETLKDTVPISSIPFLIGPVNLEVNTRAPFDPRHSTFAGTSILAAVVPRNRTNLPTSYAVCRIDIPPTTEDYLVCSKSRPAQVKYQNGQIINQSDISGASYEFDYGGGIFEPSITWLDLGTGYTNEMCKGGFDYVGIFSLNSSQASIIESSVERSISVSTSPIFGGYLNTEYSFVPTITTAPGRSGIDHFISDGGMGFYSNASIIVNQATITSGVVSASVTNIPTNYSTGQYECSVQAPASGTAASIRLIVDSGAARATILNSGIGYTSAPIVTAPAPNVQTGQIVGLTVVTSPSGYSLNTKHYLIQSNSSISGADASLGFILNNNGLSTFIDNPGYGYTQDSVATGQDPDLRGVNSFVSSINITNSPKGYRVGADYPVKIQASNSPAGNASAVMRRTSAANYAVNIVNGGYGFTSVPIVTAPAPDLKTGNIDFVSVSSLGIGYPNGIYRCDVSAPSSGGTVAQVEFVVDSETSQSFNVIDSGTGYLGSATVSVVTPVGNAISSITITCQGSYYGGDNATFVLLDANGSGAFLAPVVSAGKITGVSVLSKGCGFGDSPDIIFDIPAVIPAISVPLNAIVKDFNITTASANAILSTATQRDILMEVYETDGTNEQVVAQATVSLAKRVLE